MSRQLLILIPTLIICGGSTSGAEDLLRNGDFSQWRNGQPSGWKTELGAKNGAATPVSLIERTKDDSLQLRGDRKTRGWHVISQSVTVRPGKTHRLRFVAHADGIRREASQFNNCYVGVFLKGPGGQVVNRIIHTVTESMPTRQSLVFRASDKCRTGDVMIFLSKTGSLTVDDVKLDVLQPADSFEVLVDDMTRHYSFFVLKKTNWRDLTERYRKDLAGGEPVSFTRGAVQMLKELKDLHVWIETPQGKRIPTYTSKRTTNYSNEAVRRELTNVREITGAGRIGRTAAGYGVIQVSSLTNEAGVRRLVTAAGTLMDTPGIIVDIRGNRGGSEPLGGMIAGIFADRRRAYAGARFRNGPKHDDFGDLVLRHIGARAGPRYTKPVVCLVGPGCTSSGEGMALMMRALPHVTLVGMPTRGASGNPRPVALPNGLNVWYSRWIATLPNGTPIEGRGVPPDKEVPHRGNGDPTFAAGLKLLTQQVKEQQREPN